MVHEGNPFIDARRGEVYIHPDAIVYPGCMLIGPVRIGPRVTIYPGAIIGFGPERWYEDQVGWDNPVWIDESCVIREHVVIQRGIENGVGTKIKSRCYIGAQSHIGGDCTIREDCWIEHQTVIGQRAELMGCVEVLPKAMVGSFVTVGKFSLIDWGAVAIHDVRPGVVVQGNPACVVSQNKDSLDRNGRTFDSLSPEREEWEDIRFKQEASHVQALTY